ncbi:dioxygenase [Actibacterium mucosum KCTC 23349]|uniref:Dioxygenase n=1 Tax=Actibacterium mucosum KCTC 23349 TaxID=1454373 RepID=A0A037ZLH6_9RHOB|nr:alpha-ketoglutarate-dependent dioxygenase AlkB [Actibacterium mucosum]KAJ57301.1 dioxygenase [Actibacterium mucosum KCTC 23349]
MQENRVKSGVFATGGAEAIRLRGFDIHPGLLNADAQAALVEELRGVTKAAPLFSPVTPYGKPMRVRMTSMGKFGWFSDRSGYRYEGKHPSGVDWPPIPELVLTLWRDLTELERTPDCCLLNFYDSNARMGMHQDRDEADFSYPVVSISLGDSALFRIGNETRGGKTESIWLNSGDVVVMGGAARLTYHGVDRIRAGSSTLLPKGGRINLTLRVVT